ncbi:hypothetical protein LDC_1840, partial [sediment metagenome]
MPALNAILNTLRLTGQPLPASLTALGITQVGTSKYRETVTSDGRGTEIEITGRLA